MKYIKTFSILFITWLVVSILFEVFIWRDTPITSKFILKQVAVGTIWALVMTTPKWIIAKKKKEL